MPTALTISKAEGAPGKVYHPLQITQTPSVTPKDNQATVRIHAAALNHRDLFIRQSLYPGTTFGVPLLADGCGTVVATGAAAKQWQGKRVVLNPGSGWKDDVDGPEDPTGYKILGGTKVNPLGTAVTELVIDAGELEEAPAHLSDVEAAALPLTGLTAWRATFVKAAKAMQPGKNVLVTGIGGGVAIMALLYAAASGANVYVTSGSEEKIKRAEQMGAKGGVIYKEKGWEKKLAGMLPKENKFLDAIIDGAGSDVVDKGMRLLKAGGVISQYGMTTSPKMTWNMGAVLKNIELKGSTMGSRKEFSDMLVFVAEKKIKPIISKVTTGGLENLQEIDSLFDEMKNGSQFGKLCIDLTKGSKGSSKL